MYIMTNGLCLGVALVVGGLSLQANAHAQVFTKIVGDPLTSDRRYSEGAAWGDVNADGYLDVFVPHLHEDLPNALLINNGDGTFSEAATDPISTDAARSSGGTFGDFDNDGDLDLFVSNYYNLNNALYLNTGSGTFQRVMEGSVVNDGGFSFGSTVVDYDNDGYLDIYVTNGAFRIRGSDNFLYRNNQDGTFTRATAGPHVADGRHSSSASWCDYDDDGDQDLFVANGASRSVNDVGNAMYRNEGDGQFVEIDPLSIGIAHSYASHGSWADYDNDGDFDLYVTNFLGNNNDLYQNDGDGTFTRVTTGIIVQDGGDSVSSSWGDFDNDGDLDLYVTNDFNENNHLYTNNGDGTFAKVTSGDLVRDGGRSNGVTWADYDKDGYLDLFVPNGQQGPPQSNILYRNDGPFSNAWINITCVGTVSNTTAIGTSLLAKTTVDGESTWQRRYIAGGTGFNAQNSLPVEFGLGQAVRIDSLIITWPSGMEEIYVDVAPNQFYTATEGEGLAGNRSTAIDAVPRSAPMVDLRPAFPNPFSQTTLLTVELGARQSIAVSVYNTIGQKLRTLASGYHGAGVHRFRWDGRDASGQRLASGVYIYRIEGAGQIQTQAITLVR
ncbi:MAG: hypothetical protein RhofKO_08900 [Rhodothermales bacterium]